MQYPAMKERKRKTWSSPMRRREEGSADSQALVEPNFLNMPPRFNPLPFSFTALEPVVGGRLPPRGAGMGGGVDGVPDENDAWRIPLYT